MVKIRLLRRGAKKFPQYRIVVARSESPRDGKCLDYLGTFNPLTEPSSIRVDKEKLEKWLSVGAQPTKVVQKILKKI